MAGRAGWSAVEVVPAGLGVRQELRERRPADHVSAVARPGAVPDRDDIHEVGGDFHATAVRGTAEARLAPLCSRQVSHCLLQLLSEVFQVKHGVSRLLGRITDPAEGLDVQAHLFWSAYLLDGCVRFGED